MFVKGEKDGKNYLRHTSKNLEEMLNITKKLN